MAARAPDAPRVTDAQQASLRQFYATHPSKHLRVGTADWTYLTGGQGSEALLILPGGTRAGYPFWIMPDFESDYRVIMPVYPPVSTLAEMVAGLAAILDAEALQRVHVLGSSLGGVVAQCLARRYPERVDRLILANTGGPDPAGIPNWRLRHAMLGRLPAGLVQTLFRQQVLRDLRAVPPAELPLLRAYTTTLIRRTPPAWYRHAFALLIDFAEHYQVAPGERVAAAEWQHRVLILDSDRDHYYPRAKQEALHALYPQAQVHTFQAEGHLVALTRRQAYVSVIRQFLRGEAVGTVVAERAAEDIAVQGGAYYLARQPALLKTFDRAVPRVRPVLAARLSLDLVPISTLIAEAREEYARLILRLPYIGGQQNPLSWNLEGSAMFLAIYRVLRQHGKTAAEIGPIIYEITERWYDSYPGWVIRILGAVRLSRFYQRRLQQRAAESQLRQYPGDWVYSYVPGDGQTFDFGVDYTECGICTFYQAQGADEFTPHLCALDYVMSRKLGSGMERTTTLAEGAPRCDFRFQRGRQTVPRRPAVTLAATIAPEDSPADRRQPVSIGMEG
jgi:pimeloyl-ACP methyl ester carboxylesterase